MYPPNYIRVFNSSQIQLYTNKIHKDRKKQRTKL